MLKHVNSRQSSVNLLKNANKDKTMKNMRNLRGNHLSQ